MHLSILKEREKDMSETTVIHGTFVIERSYAATPERVFSAFADGGKKRKWFVEGPGHDVEGHEMDFRVGGKEVANFRFTSESPVKGLTCTNDATYLDIVANRRLVQASTMTIGGRCISASLVTVEILAGAGKTELILTHQGAFFEGSDGPKMREDGWRKLIDRLSGEIGL
jgi:uncharacterized protein YndB with AHSA1/START domain